MAIAAPPPSVSRSGTGPLQSKSSLPLSSPPTSIAAGMAGSVSVAAVFSGAVRHYLLTFSVLSCLCEADPDICTHVMMIFFLQRFRCLARASSLQPLSLDWVLSNTTILLSRPFAEIWRFVISPALLCWISFHCQSQVYSIQHHPRPVFTHWHNHSGNAHSPHFRFVYINIILVNVLTIIGIVIKLFIYLIIVIFL